MPYLAKFRMPTVMRITGRSSSITNAFISAIIPVIPPTSEQVQTALSILGMDLDTFHCAYCGAVASEWDHLRPLVKNKRPTGYVSEIGNLVPCCGKCNQSKGNKDWKAWIRSTAPLSPMTRKVVHLDERIGRLEKYERWSTPTKIDFVAATGAEMCQEHWDNLTRVQEAMRVSQVHASKINQLVAEAAAKKKGVGGDSVASAAQRRAHGQVATTRGGNK